jgi:hypothetical protein
MDNLETLPWILRFRQISFITFNYDNNIFHEENRVGAVMVWAITSSALDSGFEPRSGHTK